MIAIVIWKMLGRRRRGRIPLGGKIWIIGSIVRLITVVIMLITIESTRWRIVWNH